ncbi:MAG TPA: uroporphyrinogen-III synthase [Pyrinomonadaceae bacterium]
MKSAPQVLVVREFDKFSSRLKEAGFEIINFPSIKTLPVENLNELDEKLKSLEKYDGLFFTSPKAAEVFLQRKTKNEFRGKIYALGNRTKLLFENTNFETVFRESANTAEEFINSFEKSEFAGKKFLFPRGDKSLRAIPSLLKKVAEIDEIVVYRTIENTVDEALIDKIRENLRRGEIDWICFFSPSGIESFLKTFGEKSLNEIKIAAIGSTTAKKAAAKNLKVEFVSPKASAEDFAFGLIEYLKNEA